MFLIKANNQKHLWYNKLQDDFLQFVPENLGVHKEELIIYGVPEELEKWNNSNKKTFLDFELDEMVRKAKVIPATETEPEKVEFIGDPIPLLKLKKWPYDEQGNFLGNEFE